MIRFENVAMSYTDQEEVLLDISFGLQPGTFHFLTGPSGAGKTSLLKLLHLAHRPARGSIEFFGQNVEEAGRGRLTELRRRIGFVFQDFRLLDHLSALENVALPLLLRGGSRRKIQAQAAELLDWVGLKERLNALPPTLSGGEKQRVAIARAVITKPDLLLADEPTGNVDPAMAKRIFRLFVELNKTGTTTVIATHDPGLVGSYPARVLHVDGGRLSHGG